MCSNRHLRSSCSPSSSRSCRCRCRAAANKVAEHKCFLLSDSVTPGMAFGRSKRDCCGASYQALRCDTSETDIFRVAAVTNIHMLMQCCSSYPGVRLTYWYRYGCGCRCRCGGWCWRRCGCRRWCHTRGARYHSRSWGLQHEQDSRVSWSILPNACCMALLVRLWSRAAAARLGFEIRWRMCKGKLVESD